MALPSRPNVRAGLPSNPRSRSVTAGGPRYDLPPRPESAASERPSQRVRTTSSPSNPPPQLRTQRSLVDLSRSGTTSRRSERTKQDVVPPLPPLPPSNATSSSKSSRFYGTRQGSVGSIGTSTSSTSSEPSSLQSYPSYASSSTSLEDMTNEEMKDDMPEKLAPGFGSSLWSRVAAAAGSLTVNVSKAWQANVATYNGEVTPPGQESRLIRAMKAYHIEKAREPSDLPEWLFDERDRGVSSRARLDEGSPEADIHSPTQPVIPQPSRTTTSSPTRPADNGRTQPKQQWQDQDRDNAVPVSKATQRLREMTAAKRNPTIRFAEAVHPRRTGAGNNASVDSEVGSDEQRRPPLPLPVHRMPDPGSSQTPRRAPTLANVDVKGRRPAAGGLPSGVRPRRT